MRVIVVGAGLAGLSAALHLGEAGHAVTIVERSRLLGGKATSFIVDGVEVDNGQHVHLACCTSYLDLVERVGMSDALFTQPCFDVAVLRRGAPPARLRARGGLPASLSLLPAFLRYAPLRMHDRLRVAIALRHLDDPVLPGETFAAWLRRHRQTDATLRGFWNLFVVPAVNAPVEDVAAGDALFVLRTAFSDPAAARVGWSRVPLARIAEAVAARVAHVRLRTAVSSVLDDGERVHGVRCADGSELEADALVLAVPPARLAAILAGGGPPIDGLAAFTTSAIVDVHLWYDTDSVGFDFAALIDSPVQWVFQKRPGYLACSLSAAGDLVRLPEGSLIELCRRELGAVWAPLRSARLIRGAVTRDPDATFVPRPGLRRPGPRTARPNLAIAGAWTDTGWPATMESAVRSGRAAADVIGAAAGASSSACRARLDSRALELSHG